MNVYIYIIKLNIDKSWALPQIQHLFLTRQVLSIQLIYSSLLLEYLVDYLTL